MYSREQLKFDPWLSEKFFDYQGEKEITYKAKFPIPVRPKPKPTTSSSDTTEPAPENKLEIITTPETLKSFFESGEGIEFKQALKDNANSLIEWAIKNKITAQPFNKFKDLYLEYTGSNPEQNEKYFDLYSIGIPLLAGVVELIESETIPLSLCQSVIKKLASDIIKCGPGTYTIISYAYLDLTAYLNITHQWMVLRKNIAGEFVQKLLYKYNIPAILELHYVNVILNHVTDILSITKIADAHNSSCTPTILNSLIDEFCDDKKGITSELTAEAVLGNITLTLEDLVHETLRDLNLMSPLEKIIIELNKKITALNNKHFSGEEKPDPAIVSTDRAELIAEFTPLLQKHQEMNRRLLILKKLEDFAADKENKMQNLDTDYSQIILQNFATELNRYGIDSKFYDYEEFFVSKDYNVTYQLGWKVNQLLFLSVFERLSQSQILSPNQPATIELPALKATLHYYPDRPLNLAYICLSNCKSYEKKYHSFLPYCVETLATTTNKIMRDNLIKILQSDLLKDADRLEFINQISRYLKSTEFNNSDDKEDERKNLIAAIHELVSPHYSNIMSILSKFGSEDIKEFASQFDTFMHHFSQDQFLALTNNNDELLLLCADVNLLRELIKQNRFLNKRYLASNISPLSLTIQFNRPEVVQLLIEHGASVIEPFPDNHLPITWAAENSNVEMLEVLLKNGADPNQVPASGKSALLLSVEAGNIENVKVLLKYKANPNIIDKNDNTLLFIAAEKNLDIFKVLLESDLIDLYKTNSKKESIFYHSIEKNWLEIYKLLLAHKQTDSNALYSAQTLAATPLYSGTTPLMMAVRLLRHEIITLMLENKVDVNRPDKYGRTALGCAIAHRDINVFNQLLNAGALPSLSSESLLHVAVENECDLNFYEILLNTAEVNPNVLYLGTTALMQAIKLGKTSVVEFFLKNKKVDCHLANEKGDTALHVAVQKGEIEFVKLLLNAGANPNAANKKGDTPLHLATQANQHELFELLIASGALTNVFNQKRETPLHKLVSNNVTETVKILASDKVDFNYADANTWTLLQLAISNKFSEMTTLLIEKGVDVNKLGKGETALHLAVQYQRIDVVEQLLEAGAISNLPNEKNETPLHLAISGFEEKIAFKLLDQEIINLNGANRDGHTPLHLAVQRNLSDIVKKLIDKGADVNSIDQQGNTPLHLVMFRNAVDAETVTYLLESDKLDPTIKNRDGFSALYYAVKHNNLPLIKIMLQHKIHGLTFKKEMDNLLFESAKNGDLVSVKDLLQTGMSPLTKDESGSTPYILAKANSHLSIAQVIEVYITTNLLDEALDTPRHKAIIQLLDIAVSGGSDKFNKALLFFKTIDAAAAVYLGATQHHQAIEDKQAFKKKALELIEAGYCSFQENNLAKNAAEFDENIKLLNKKTPNKAGLFSNPMQRIAKNTASYIKSARTPR